MLSRITGLIGCVRGQHERCEQRAYKVNNTYHSVCRHCGAKMRRVAKRDWVID